MSVNLICAYSCLVRRAVSDEEVAVFLLDEVEQNRYVHEAVFVGHE